MPQTRLPGRNGPEGSGARGWPGRRETTSSAACSGPGGRRNNSRGRQKRRRRAEKLYPLPAVTAVKFHHGHRANDHCSAPARLRLVETGSGNEQALSLCISPKRQSGTRPETVAAADPDRRPSATCGLTDRCRSCGRRGCRSGAEPIQCRSAIARASHSSIRGSRSSP